jgi:hypothetical protein
MGLEYPSDRECQKLASLAQVDDPDSFSQHIHHIILDAHLNDASLRDLSVPQVKIALQKVSASARQLRMVLQGVDVGTKASVECAGMLLEYEIGVLQLSEKLVLIPEWVRLLSLLDDAACRAAHHVKPKRGPKGAGGNAAFDKLIESLLLAAWQGRGYWTVYRAVNGIWTGSFLEALQILKPYLPIGFFPGGELGRAVEYVRNKLQDHIAKNQTGLP